MKAYIAKRASTTEFMTDERCSICEIANTQEDQQVSIAQARVGPKIATAWHRLHDTTERYIIINGTGRAEIESLEPTEVSSGDVISIPPGFAQRIVNTGDVDLIFYCVCSPRFQQKNYETLE